MGIDEKQGRYPHVMNGGRDPYIVDELNKPKYDWMGYPRCHIIPCDCILPEMPGSGKKCWRCDIK